MPLNRAPSVANYLTFGQAVNRAISIGRTYNAHFGGTEPYRVRRRRDASGRWRWFVFIPDVPPHRPIPKEWVL